MNRARIVLCGGAVVVASALTACGGSDTTTVIKEPTTPVAQTVTTTTTAPAPKPARAPSPKPKPATQEAAAPASVAPAGNPPDVVGLTLPEAKRELSAAGFRADVSNTDTLLGIVVPRNYTVCKEQAPRGEVVPILAQKYGC